RGVGCRGRESSVRGFRGRRCPAVLDCHAVAMICQAAGQRLSPVGVKSSFGPTANPLVVVVGTFSGLRGSPQAVAVGPWSPGRATPPAAFLADGPESSGVFAQFVGTKKPLLELLNQQGQPAGSVGKGGGLIAALREGDGPPTWVVTGTDDKGVAAAASLLGPALRNHYAVATQPGAGAIGVPVQ